MFAKVFNKIVITLAKFHRVVCCDFKHCTNVCRCMLCAHIKNCPVIAAIVMAKELNKNTVNDVLLGKTDEHEGTLGVSNSADGQNNSKNHSAGLAGKTSADGSLTKQTHGNQYITWSTSGFCKTRTT